MLKRVLSLFHGNVTAIGAEALAYAVRNGLTMPGYAPSTKIEGKFGVGPYLEVGVQAPFLGEFLKINLDVLIVLELEILPTHYEMIKDEITGQYVETLWTRTQKADRETGC